MVSILCVLGSYSVPEIAKAKRKGGVSDCVETPPSHGANSLRERSKHPSIRSGYRFPIIRLAVQNTLQKPSKTFVLL